MTTVLVSGDREWSDYDLVLERLSQLPNGSTVIHGAARGADTLAGNAAQSLGLRVIAVPANWSLYHRAAGPIRNRQMLDMRPELVIAFHDDLESSKGTRDCVMEARRRGIPVELVSHK